MSFPSQNTSKCHERAIHDIIRGALDEDVGWGGEDVTANATIADGTTVKARFLAKQDGVLAGLDVAEKVLKMVDRKLSVTWSESEGAKVTKGTYFGTVLGPANSLVLAERIALNIMQRMSGIATATRVMQDLCKPHKARILDTRKTTPGMRVLDKWAVKIGGGTNHRFGLHDMVMIKDNHVTAAGGLPQAVARVKEYLYENKINVPIEVETRTLEEVTQALAIGGIDRLMLDNMARKTATGTDTTMMVKALEIIDGRIDTEASGNVTVDTVAAIAATGVDYISTGAITHSVMAMDISLKIVELTVKSKL